MHSGSSLPTSLTEKVVGGIPRFVCPKTKLFDVKFRRILEVLCLQDLQKKLWAQFHTLCVQKRSCLLWSSDAFWKFLHCKLCKKYFWVHFYDSCIQKRGCLPWKSDAFWEFSAWVWQKKLWVQFHDLCVKNEAVCCEIQMHFGSSLPVRFTEKVVGAITRFMRQKTKLFAVKFRRILEVFALRAL